MKSGPLKFPKTDKRLLGKWKSDTRRTFADWNWKKNTTPAKKRRLKSYFGKLILTFTPSHIVTHLPHRQWQTSRRYAVLGLDETSVAIIKFGEPEIKNQRKYSREGLQTIKQLFVKPEIRHIHFEKNYLSIPLGDKRNNREFFRKLK